MLETLHLAVVSEWNEQVYIPNDVINRMASWLNSVQNSSGAWIETSDNYYSRNFVARLL